MNSAQFFITIKFMEAYFLTSWKLPFHHLFQFFLQLIKADRPLINNISFFKDTTAARIHLYNGEGSVSFIGHKLHSTTNWTSFQMMGKFSIRHFNIYKGHRTIPQ